MRLGGNELTRCYAGHTTVVARAKWVRTVLWLGWEASTVGSRVHALSPTSGAVLGGSGMSGSEAWLEEVTGACL